MNRVTILVFLAVVLQLQKETTNERRRNRYNPCFSGGRFATEQFGNMLAGLCGVTILVFLAVVLQLNSQP